MNSRKIIFSIFVLVATYGSLWSMQSVAIRTNLGVGSKAARFCEPNFI